jgi:hypothetical protein
MILTQIEINAPMAGLATHVIKQAFLTTILIQRLTMLSEPLISTQIYLVRQSPTSPAHLQIKYESVDRLMVRIAYVIFRSHIASPIQDWVWRPYVGVDNHNSHLHISFTPKGDNDGKPFAIPMLKGK